MGMTGKRFMEARLDKGYTLENVAKALNIDVRYIFDLENEDYDDLPGQTYALGYAQTYARFLGISPDLVATEIMGAVGFNREQYENEKDGMFLGYNERALKREKNLAAANRKVSHQRSTLFLCVLGFVIIGILAFLGTRTWFL